MGNDIELPAEPKIFISYSWSSADHERWVVELAEALVEKGVEVKLDKWDLKLGHDADAFMESMVTDPTITKVLLICDAMYVTKSNERSGGAGTEAQIITPHLYRQAQQDKFVAVLRERGADGKALLPAYYGSRLYIDLSGPSNPTQFDRLLRWIWNEPLDVRPVKGSKPSFLNPDSQQMKTGTSTTHRQALAAIKGQSPTARAEVVEYLDLVADGLENFRIKVTQDNRAEFDDVVYKSIDEFTPYRNELIELFAAIAKYDKTEEMAEAVHRFFEKLIPYMYRSPNAGQYTDVDFDNFRFIARELFLYAVASAIKFENFLFAAYLFNNEYYWKMVDGSPKGDMHSFKVFGEHAKSFEIRNNRLGTRRTSLSADMMKSRNQGSGIHFDYILTAEFVAYLRGRSGSDWRSWWPDTLLYVDHYGNAFEIFARAKSGRYFNRMRDMLGVADATHFQADIAAMAAVPQNMPHWQFSTLDVNRLSGAANIATLP
ncbi:toll/interleukin-1 receptor domain-containing protein [Rhizobium sp. HT1-10]|uniref:toll/interleukin-1 receptor domain-containing protein n=1 Tax=Rhizobium sp. HT1-10 TaxID=3111638 RepID=UPI003C25AC7A